MKKKIIVTVALIAVIAMLATVLVACAPKADDVEKGLKDAGYVVTRRDNDAPDKNGMVCSIEALKGSIGTEGISGEMVAISFFDSTDNAKKAMDEITEEEKKDLEEQGLKVERSGKVIFIGTEKGIEDAKK